MRTDEDDNPGNNDGGRDGMEPGRLHYSQQLMPMQMVKTEWNPPTICILLLLMPSLHRGTHRRRGNEPARHAARSRAIQSQGAEAARLLTSPYNTRPHRNDAIHNEKRDRRIRRRRCGRRVK